MAVRVQKEWEEASKDSVLSFEPASYVLASAAHLPAFSSSEIVGTALYQTPADVEDWRA